MTTTVKAVAQFIGCVIENCRIGGTRNLRGIYAITDPESNTGMYERHTSQMRGMGWNKTTVVPTTGRIHSWIGSNGHHSGTASHILVYREPEEIEVAWQPCWEVAAEYAAITLVGRAHVQKNLQGIARLMEPACTVAEAMEAYTPETHPGWSLQSDTGHGAVIVGCPELDREIQEVETKQWRAFNELLNETLLKRALWEENGKPTFQCLRKTDQETIAAAIGFNCGISSDFVVPQEWVPSPEVSEKLASLRLVQSETLRADAEMMQAFETHWSKLRERYSRELEKIGLKLAEATRSERAEFRVVAHGPDSTFAGCPAGGRNGPGYHTPFSKTLEWMVNEAENHDVAASAAHLKQKIEIAQKKKG